MSGPSFGVEEEFLLVDPLTGSPAPCSGEVAHHAALRGVPLQLEFTAAQIEAATEKTDSSVHLRQQISQLRAVTAESAAQAGALLLAVGLPPVQHEPPALSGNLRYRHMAERLGMIAEARGNCGCHVHVEVPSRDAAIAVSNWLRPWLPALLALTANSAIYRGADTGHASWRHVMWSRWPSAGPPPYFDSVAHYDRVVAMLADAGAVFDDGMLYWDVRPSARYPTVEVRIADVPATAAETVLYATVVRAAVMTALAAYERGERAAHVPEYEIRTACWKAAHEGLCSAPVIPLLTELRPALDELGDTAWVFSDIRRLLHRGNGAIRQRREWFRRGLVSDLVAAAAAATVGASTGEDEIDQGDIEQRDEAGNAPAQC